MAKTPQVKRGGKPKGVTRKAGVKATGPLTTKERAKVPKKKFGIPSKKGAPASKGKYPMPDKAHAANAKARATQQLKKGSISKSQHAAIIRKANKILYGKAAQGAKK